jgi:peptidoglycan/xylan/chitin deacetylase (PgdA/CDA1 family)
MQVKGKTMTLKYDFIRRASNYFQYYFAPHVVLLLYHRVADLPLDPQLLTVSADHFNEQLEILRRYTRLITLDELTIALREGRLPRRGVAITFDDGYADNLYNAAPLLERHEIPATVFVTAGQLGCRTEFWWDELERLLLLPGKLPATLSLSINGSDDHWNVNGAAGYTEEDYQRNGGWHIEQTEDPTPRHKLYRSLYHRLHALHGTERQSIIERLQTWAAKDSLCRPSHRMLTEDEIVFMAKGGLIQVGAHTMTHPMLTRLPAAAQRDEIVQSKASLEEMLNRPVHSFAYPHGAYSDETLACVREAGFVCACSSDTAVVLPDADPLRLPRFVVRNWDGDRFHRWLKGLISS